jgi:L-alanine-DL-glutamate epimerase-like enolase superfamily enzyme
MGLRRFPPTSGKRRIKLYSRLLQHLYKGQEKEAAVAVDQALWALRGATREAIEGAHAELGKGRREPAGLVL